jgi:hypothetical protein
MPHPALPVTLLALAAPLAAAVDDPVRYAQVIVRERVIVHMRPTPPAPIRWKESKGPRCIAVADLAGALMPADDQLDLVLRGGRRVRARLDDDCRNLDFYKGFYLRPREDGQVCAKRDTIRVRSGRACAIGRFRLLTPKR